MDFQESLRPYYEEKLIDEVIASFSNGKQTHALLLNPRKINEEEFLSRFPKLIQHPFVPHAYLYQKEDYEFGKSIYYEAGAISIEDPAAMMVNYFLSPKPGEFVLDGCAAPGGKSLGAIFQMKEEGLMVANEFDFGRAKNLIFNLERCGVGNAVVTNFDLAHEDIKEFHNFFDKMILDVPCSGSFMFRKDELAKKLWSKKKVDALLPIQKDILEKGFSYLKPGGILAYSTCSFSYEEDVGMILDFLSLHPEAKLLKAKDDPSFYHHPNLPEAIYLLPSRFEGEGQFICLIQKAGEIVPNKVSLVSDKKFDDIIKKYHLESRSNEVIGTSLCSLTAHMDISKKMKILSYGVKLFEDISSPYKFEHQFAKFLPANFSISISQEECTKYLMGETLNLNIPDGFYPVSYSKMNLGWIKKGSGPAKNHYPKGLRKKVLY